jgi:hypothetical protein
MLVTRARYQIPRENFTIELSNEKAQQEQLLPVREDKLLARERKSMLCNSLNVSPEQLLLPWKAKGRCKLCARNPKWSLVFNKSSECIAYPATIYRIPWSPYLLNILTYSWWNMPGIRKTVEYQCYANRIYRFSPNCGSHVTRPREARQRNNRTSDIHTYEITFQWLTVHLNGHQKSALMGKRYYKILVVDEYR